MASRRAAKQLWTANSIDDGESAARIGEGGDESPDGQAAGVALRTHRMTGGVEHLPGDRAAFRPRGAFRPGENRFTLRVRRDGGVLAVAGRAGDLAGRVYGNAAGRGNGSGDLGKGRAPRDRVGRFDAAVVHLAGRLPRAKHAGGATRDRVSRHRAGVERPAGDAVAREVAAIVDRA